MTRYDARRRAGKRIANTQSYCPTAASVGGGALNRLPDVTCDAATHSALTACAIRDCGRMFIAAFGATNANISFTVAMRLAKNVATACLCASCNVLVQYSGCAIVGRKATLKAEILTGQLFRYEMLFLITRCVCYKGGKRREALP